MKPVNQVRDSASDHVLRNWQRMAGDLPDINVWLALAQPEHPHHRAAQAYWQQTMQQLLRASTAAHTAQPKMYFCRTTMLGLVRVLCQSGRAQGRTIELHHAMAAYQRFMQIEQVGFAQEAWPAVDAAMAALLAAHPQLPLHMSTDVYLAALAQASGLRLVSFDRDYARFADLDCLILEPQIG